MKISFGWPLEWFRVFEVSGLDYLKIDVYNWGYLIFDFAFARRLAAHPKLGQRIGPLLLLAKILAFVTLGLMLWCFCPSENTGIKCMGQVLP